MTSPPPPHAAGSIRVDCEDGGRVLRLEGEIDSAAVDAFERTTGRPDADKAQVVAVDASGVTFLSSAGVGLLLRCTQTVRDAGRRPVLREPTRQALRTLELTGILPLFDEL